MGTKDWYASERLLEGLDCSVRKNNIISPQEKSFVKICSHWRMKRNYSCNPFLSCPSLRSELCLYWITDNHFWPEETNQDTIPVSAFQMEVWVPWHLHHGPAHRVSFSGLQTAMQSKGPSLQSSACDWQCQLVFLEKIFVICVTLHLISIDII